MEENFAEAGEISVLPSRILATQVAFVETQFATVRLQVASVQSQLAFKEDKTLTCGLSYCRSTIKTK